MGSIEAEIVQDRRNITKESQNYSRRSFHENEILFNFRKEHKMKK